MNGTNPQHDLLAILVIVFVHFRFDIEENYSITFISTDFIDFHSKKVQLLQDQYLQSCNEAQKKYNLRVKT